MFLVPLLCVSIFVLSTDPNPVSVDCVGPVSWYDAILEIDDCMNKSDFICEVKYEPGRIVFEHVISLLRSP